MTTPATTADVIVVGAGIMGCAAAFEMSKLGLRVVVVDKGSGAGHGSTGASSAIVRFNYSTWDGVATAWESRHYWQEWLDYIGLKDESGVARFHPTGKIMLDAPVSPRNRVAALFDQVGVAYEQWDAATLRARVPGIDTGRYWPPKAVDDEAFFAPPSGELGALYTPDAGFVDDPQLAAHNLAVAAQNRGTTFIFKQAVTEIEQRGGRLSGVALSDGTRLASPVLLNAAGPWSSALNRLAGVGAEFTIRVRPLRQEVHQVRAPAGFNRDSQFGPAITDLDLGTYMRPGPGGVLLVGGTEPDCDPFEWVDDPDQVAPQATATRFHAQVMRAARRLPELTVPNIPTGIVGVYDVAEDWTPIYDRTDLDGYYVAMGTSGNQFKNAPLVGRFMATLVAAVENGHDHDAQPLGYHCEHTGRAINIGAFSRKREINAESTGTVVG
jgi:sarcosine oxidase subunit beta